MTRPRKKLRANEVRLGVGDVVPDGPNAIARDCLLAAITKRCPEMVDALAAIAEGPLDKREKHLDAWIKQWRCSDPWLAQVARDTEESWRRDAILRRHRHWQYAVSWWAIGAATPAPSWDPAGESREDYQQRHERYLQMLETQAAQNGFVDAPIKRAPEHFEWLALYHFGSETVEDIAEDRGGTHGLENRSVSLGIADAAKRCGLTLDRRRGRPPKTNS